MPSGDFVLLILLGVPWDSWICSLMSVTSFGKFSAFFISNIYSLLSFFSFWYSHYTYLITLYAPLPPGCSVSSFFSPLHFSLKSYFTAVCLPARWLFAQLCLVCWWHILHFWCSARGLQHFPLFVLRVPLSVLTAPIWSACGLIFPWEPLTLITKYIVT